MKKKLLLIPALISVMAFSAIGFTACKDDNTDVNNPGTPVGDKWSDWDDWEDWDAGFADSYTEFIPTFDYNEGMKVEAEDTKYSSCNVSDGGSGKIIDWTNDNTTVKFNLIVAEQTTVELFVKVAVDFSDNRSRKISDRLALTLKETAAELSGEFTHTYDGDWWSTYYLVSVGEITLAEGENSVELKLSDSLNLDYIQFGKAPAPAFNYTGNGYIVQAENTESTECRISDGGSGKVLDWTNDNTTVKFIVKAEEAATVKLFVKAAVDFADNRSHNIADRLALTLNGVTVELSGTLTHTNDGDWWLNYVLVSLGEITLNAGDNAIELKLSDSLNLDYIQFGEEN